MNFTAFVFLFVSYRFNFISKKMTKLSFPVIIFLFSIVGFWACKDAPNVEKQHSAGIDTASLKQYTAEIISERQNTDSIFRYSEDSPLPEELKKAFTPLEYFPVDTAYRIKAKFVRTPDASSFGMPTTTDRLPEYVKYGEAHFKLHGKNLILSIYQNQELKTNPEYADYLFMPFADATNSRETYSGGRYLDLTIPKNDTIIIDFNKAYNPYCAYNHRYSCPLIPSENVLNVSLKAGVMDFEKH